MNDHNTFVKFAYPQFHKNVNQFILETRADLHVVPRANRIR